MAEEEKAADTTVVRGTVHVARDPVLIQRI